MFRGEDHLHSGGVSSGPSSTDGNESSPNPVYENGNILHTLFLSRTVAKSLFGCVTERCGSRQRHTFSTLLTIESPAVAQWLERPPRSRGVVGLNPIWNSDFFRVFSWCYFYHFIFLMVYQFGRKITSRFILLCRWSSLSAYVLDWLVLSWTRVVQYTHIESSRLW